MKRFLSALTIVALLLFPTLARAQTANQQPIAFSLSAAGQSSPVFNTQNLSTCAVVVQNTSVGMSLVPQATSDSQATIAAGAAQWSTTGVLSNAITTFGQYTGNVAVTGLTGFRVLLNASTSGGPVTGSIYCSSASAAAQAQNSGGPATPFACDNSYAINGATANVQFVTGVAGRSIRICGIAFTAAGTTPTVQIVYGTGTVCATGTVLVTGALAPLANTPFAYGSGFATIAAPSAASANACLFITGTTPVVNGIVTYEVS
jgi:hypothetical protein